MEALEKKQFFSEKDGQVKVVRDVTGPQDGVKVQLNVPRSAFMLVKPKCLALSIRRAMLSVTNLRMIVLSIAVTYLVSTSDKWVIAPQCIARGHKEKSGMGSSYEKAYKIRVRVLCSNFFSRDP